MPVIKSAEKRDRQAKIRRERNLVVKKAINTKTKAFTKLVASKDAQKAQVALAAIVSQLDKAAKTNVLHKNTVARRKSQLAKIFNQLGAQPSTTKKAVVKKSATTKESSKK